MSGKFLKTVAPIALAGGVYYYFNQQIISAANAPAKPALLGDGQWVDFKVKAIRNLSDDTKLVTFDLPADENLGLITASCVLAKYVTPKGSNVIRPYTPISDIAKKGEFDVLVKKYEGGKMSGHIHNLAVNDTLTFKGPVTKWKWAPGQFKEVGLVAGGTGIAPMFQVIHEVLKNDQDKTKLTLLYGSKTPEDILLKNELDHLAQQHPEQFQVKYFVDSGKQEGLTEGFITKDVLDSTLPKPAEDTHVFVCGPPAMYKVISGNKVSPTDQGEVSGLLQELGYTKEHVFKF